MVDFPLDRVVTCAGATLVDSIVTLDGISLSEKHGPATERWRGKKRKIGHSFGNKRQETEWKERKKKKGGSTFGCNVSASGWPTFDAGSFSLFGYSSTNSARRRPSLPWWRNTRTAEKKKERKECPFSCLLRQYGRLTWIMMAASRSQIFNRPFILLVDL